MWNMFKVNNKDARTMPLASFFFFIVTFEHISHLILVSLLLILNMHLPGVLGSKMEFWFNERQNLD